MASKVLNGSRALGDDVCREESSASTSLCEEIRALRELVEINPKVKNMRKGAGIERSEIYSLFHCVFVPQASRFAAENMELREALSRFGDIEGSIEDEERMREEMQTLREELLKLVSYSSFPVILFLASHPWCPRLLEVR